MSFQLIQVSGHCRLCHCSAAGAFALDQCFGPRAEACGIIGVVSKGGAAADPAVNFLLEGLHIMQNRGYDSAGISTLHDDKGCASGDLFFLLIFHTLIIPLVFRAPRSKGRSIVTTKHASVGSTSDSIQLLDQNAPARHQGDSVGIAHTVRDICPFFVSVWMPLSLL